MPLLCSAYMRVQLGASISTSDSLGRSALHHAVTPRGSDDIVSLLLAKGSDPYLTDKAGLTPRMMAVEKKYTEGVPHPSDIDEAQVGVSACWLLIAKRDSMMIFLSFVA